MSNGRSAQGDLVDVFTILGSALLGDMAPAEEAYARSHDTEPAPPPSAARPERAAMCARCFGAGEIVAKTADGESLIVSCPTCGRKDAKR